jgi:predicted phage terminase large subunit-like protein
MKTALAAADPRKAAAFVRRLGLSREAIAKERAERSLGAFVAQAWPVVEHRRPFVGGWHLDAECDHLEAVARGEIADLIINVPFRTTKSLLACVFWPAWVWAREPGFQWLFSSYSAQLSIRDSVRCRRLVESAWYRERWSNPRCACSDRCCRPLPGEERGPACADCACRFLLRLDQNQKVRFDNTALGYRIATSVGGSGTGEGGDCIVVDDPHNVHEAESAAAREEVKHWWDEVMSSRSNDPRRRRRVIIGQRVGPGDLSAHALAKGGYEHVVLPMRFERGFACAHAGGCSAPGRATRLGFTDPREEEGELLCPERFGEAEVRQLEIDLGVFGTAAQMQQRPEARGGRMFKREWFHKVLPAPPAKVRKRVRWWDLAATPGGGDWTVGERWSLDEDGLLVVEHMIREQLGPAEVRDLVLATAHADGRGCVVGLFVDPGQAGKDQAQQYARLLRGFRLAFLTPTNPESAADLWAAQAGAANIALVEGPWVEAWVDEVCGFPGARYDDVVAAGSGAFRWLAGQAVRPEGDSGITL